MSTLAQVPRGLNGAPMALDQLLISMGCYDGIHHVNKFGSIVEAATDTQEDMWDAGGTYTFPDGTADITHVSQTTDQTAARGATVVVEGLTTAYVAVVQLVTLDASDTTTPAALTTPLMRLNRAYVRSSVVLTSTVRVHNAAETVDYADMQIDHNQTLNAIYTVPAGKTAFITTITADHARTVAKDPSSVHYHILVRRNAGSEGWRAIESFSTQKQGAGFNRAYDPYLHIPEKSDVRITIKANDSTAHAHASFDMVLVDNATYPGMASHVNEEEFPS